MDTHLENLRRDHARWSAEHGHWAKDLRVWRDEHAKALAACARIETLVRRFDHLAPPFQRDLALHDEEVRLHAKELANAAPGSKHPGEELHKCGDAEHARELEAHDELRRLHDQILEEIGNLTEELPSRPPDPTRCVDEIERVPEI